MRFISILLLTLLCNAAIQAEVFPLQSPDRGYEIRVETGRSIHISVKAADALLVSIKDPGLRLGTGEQLGRNPGRARASRSTSRAVVRPVVPVKQTEINAAFEELYLAYPSGFGLRIRAFNDGFAYRFETSRNGRITVRDEQAIIAFPPDTRAFIPGETGFQSHYEVLYRDTLLHTLEKDRICILPMLFTTPSGHRVVVSESDLFDYPGMFLAGDGGHRVRLSFPPVVLETEPGPAADRSERITRVGDYIAETTGTRNFPWRIFMIADDDRKLLTNELVYLLSRENQIGDPSWIKPGKVAWEWWNAWNITGVDFHSGINTETYKYYIDFAHKYGLEYLIMDEGWSPTTRLTETVEDVDLPELISYGRRKGVGIILWVLWKPLDQDLEVILDTYQAWGVKGIKVDFMQRADQYMVNYYERVAEAAAARKLVVDFHGAFKPSGLRTAWPNVLTYEGVKGMENCKWSTDISPEYALSIPFIRMTAGPMDFTPGAMRNAHPENFKISWNRPMSLGTRCHQLAMFVVFESPLQMLADNPTQYLKEDPCTRFISRIPTTWDETRVLEAEVADHLLIARRKGRTWYLAGMTDATARELSLPLNFLPHGTYVTTIMEDGINAGRNAEDYRQILKSVSPADTIQVKMAAGGGWAAILEPGDGRPRRDPALIKGNLVKPEK